jgi:DNA repair protein SbcC/Rad50
MLGKLFTRTPLWQHEDADQRVLGVGALAADSPEILRLLADPAPQVRSLAFSKTSNVGALLGQLSVERECETALRSRIVELLSGADETQRESALLQLGGESVMAELAITAPTAALRLAAAKRVHEIPLLRAGLEKARVKDHGVAKIFADKISAVESAAGRENEARLICEALASLVEKQEPIVSAVVDLDRRFAALQPNAPFENVFNISRSLIQSRFDREQQSQRERNVWLRDFDLLKAMEQTSEATQASLDAAKNAYESLNARASGHPELKAKLEHSGAKAALEMLEKSLTAQSKADELLHDFAPPVLEASRLVEFEDRWNGIAPEGKDALRQQRFDDLLIGHRRQLNAANATDAASQSEARQKLHALLANAEESLAAGAVQAAAQFRDELKPLRAIAGELPKPTNQRLGRLSQQLGDLLRWQSFGNATQREEMCNTAEQMPSQGLGVAELAKAVQALRDQWKQLDQSQAPAPRALWERFNTACEIAYAPAAEHFTKLATERKEAQTRREAAIKEASDYAGLALMPVEGLSDWTPDGKAITAWLAKHDSQWRTLGHVDRRKTDTIESEWRATTQPLRAVVNAQRSGESSEREKLIAQVKALLVDGKLAGGAVSKVKEAQTAWQIRAKATPLPRKQEQALWEIFRQSCNDVFETLGKERDARSSAFGESIAKKNALIDEYFAIQKSADEKTIRAAINDAPKRWAAIGDSGRENERKLADRFDRTLRDLRDGLRNADRNKGALQLRSLLEVEAACGIWDASAHAGLSPGAGDWEPGWKGIDGLPPAWKQKMLARKALAENAIKSGAGGVAKFAAIISKSEAERTNLILNLEDALGIQSPEISQSDRMKRQVARLADRLKSGGVQLPHIEQLAAICALSGRSANVNAKRLEAIALAIAAKK